MSGIPISLAVEDDLSESVLRCILGKRPIPYLIGTVYKKDGFGYLKKNCEAFNNIANGSPVLLLTDLDAGECASKLIEEWFSRPKHPDFLFRVAVREVEAWLLASDSELKDFLKVRTQFSFSDPESVEDPKRELFLLAKRSSDRAIREGIVRKNRDGSLQQGPAYNSTLIPFLESWSMQNAAQKCNSLERLFDALTELEERRR